MHVVRLYVFHLQFSFSFFSGLIRFSSTIFASFYRILFHLSFFRTPVSFRQDIFILFLLPKSPFFSAHRLAVAFSSNAEHSKCCLYVQLFSYSSRVNVLKCYNKIREAFAEYTEAKNKMNEEKEQKQRKERKAKAILTLVNSQSHWRKTWAQTQIFTHDDDDGTERQEKGHGRSNGRRWRAKQQEHERKCMCINILMPYIVLCAKADEQTQISRSLFLAYKHTHTHTKNHTQSWVLK